MFFLGGLWVPRVHILRWSGHGRTTELLRHYIEDSYPKSYQTQMLLGVSKKYTPDELSHWYLLLQYKPDLSWLIKWDTSKRFISALQFVLHTLRPLVYWDLIHCNKYQFCYWRYIVQSIAITKTTLYEGQCLWCTIQNKLWSWHEIVYRSVAIPVHTEL